MSFLDHLQELQGRPREVRKRVALTYSLAFTVVILLFWGTTFFIPSSGSSMASVSGQKSEVDLTPLSNIKNALSDLFVTFKEVKDTAIKVQGSMVLSESGSSTVTTTYQNDGGESFTATATTSTSTKHEMEDGIRVLKKLGNKVGTTTSTATSTAKR